MDITKNTSTGTLLGTYERSLDLGIFDGNTMSATGGASSSTVTRHRVTTVPRRVSTPIPPKRAVGLVIGGVVLVVAGFAAVGYAGFQLYGTNIIAARNQSDLSAEFATRLEAGPSHTVPAVVATEVVVDAADFEDADDVPVVIGTIIQAPLPPPATALTWVHEGAPEPGAPVGRLVIPDIGFDWVVIEGIGVENLKSGPGHMSNSAMPGQLGNAVISGHRTTYGSPFNRLNELEPGSRFTFETLVGVHTYEVVSVQIVTPAEAWVTAQWEGGWMTFTTCNPEFSSRQRLIVFSRLVDGPNREAIEIAYRPSYLPPVAPPGTSPGGAPWYPSATTTTLAPSPTTTTVADGTTTTTTPAEETTTTSTPPEETTTTEGTTTTTVGGEGG